MINAWLGYKSTWSGKSPTPCLVDWFVLICKLKNHLSVEIFIILIDFINVCIRISIKNREKKIDFKFQSYPNFVFIIIKSKNIKNNFLTFLIWKIINQEQQKKAQNLDGVDFTFSIGFQVSNQNLWPFAEVLNEFFFYFLI